MFKCTFRGFLVSSAPPVALAGGILCGKQDCCFEVVMDHSRHRYYWLGVHVVKYVSSFICVPTLRRTTRGEPLSSYNVSSSFNTD